MRPNQVECIVIEYKEHNKVQITEMKRTPWPRKQPQVPISKHSLQAIRTKVQFTEQQYCRNGNEIYTLTKKEEQKQHRLLISTSNLLVSLCEQSYPHRYVNWLFLSDKEQIYSPLKTTHITVPEISITRIWAGTVIVLPE